MYTTEEELLNDTGVNSRIEWADLFGALLAWFFEQVMRFAMPLRSLVSDPLQDDKTREETSVLEFIVLEQQINR